MSETPMSPKSRPLVARVALWLAAAIVAAIVLILVVHVMIRPVSPDQPAPVGHFGGPCGLCHFVSGGTDVISVE